MLISAPLTLYSSKRVVPNRLFKAAMSERLCSWDDENLDECGKPTPGYIELYRKWGEGGAGVIVTGNTPVDRDQPEAPKNAIIDARLSWDAVEAFKPVFAAAKAYGSLVLVQLTAGGRQTNDKITLHPVSSGDIQMPPAFGMTFAKPRPMTVEEIKVLVERFGHAAEVVYKAGGDGVQLHAAHGYLLSQFLSANINNRTDSYGGPLENRSKILFEIIDAIKAKVPETFILSIKINSADFSDGGFTPEESRLTIQKLDEAGMDLIELSGGTYETVGDGFEALKPSTAKREAFFLDFADNVRPHLKKSKLVVTGGFRTVSGMEGALADGACDLIGLASPLTGQPTLCKDLLAGTATSARVNKAPVKLQMPLAVGQIQEIAAGREPADLSDEVVVQKELAALMEMMVKA
ncbi:NADH oxidase [Pseudohyphozyma bogoriensis]|nr:NADH oxidase [Pseudohyphozyma bogoriensis]